MNRTRSAVVVVTLAVLLGSAGCSEDDPQPKIAPSSQSPSPTAVSSEPTPSPSVEPLDPVETVEAWVEARNEALASGDTGAVEALSADECESCFGLIDPIEKIYAAGGRFDTVGWRVASSKVRSPTPEGRAVVDAGIIMAQGETVSEPGAEPVVYGAERHIVVFKLVDTGDGSLVRFIGFLS